MATVKARLDNIYRDIGRAGGRWQSVVDVFGSAYSEAYDQHKNHMPTALPPNEAVILLSKIIAGLMSLAAGTVLNPVTVVVVFTGVSMMIEEVGAKLGSSDKPKDSNIPNPKPLPVWATFKQQIRDFTLDCQDVLDKYLEVVDKIKQAELDHSQPTEKKLEQLEKFLEASTFMHPPDDYRTWNQNNKLANEMEKIMWASWGQAITDPDVWKKTVRTDLSKPFKRLQELKVFEKVKGYDIAPEGASEKVQIMLSLRIMKWAKRYRPAKKFGGMPPKKVVQFAEKMRKVANKPRKKQESLRSQLQKTLEESKDIWY